VIILMMETTNVFQSPYMKNIGYHYFLFLFFLIIISVFVWFKYFKPQDFDLPNSWFWDHKRIISSNYKISDNKPIFYYQKVKPGSKEETYLNLLMKNLDFEDLQIDDSYAIVSPNLAMAVSIARNVQTLRMRSNPSQFFSQSWKSFEDFEMRQKIINWYMEKLFEWDWNEGLQLESSPILPVVHGTDGLFAWKIAQGGFASLSTLDDGFYGKGIYFSTSAKYILPYCAHKKNPTILICLIIPGNVYPVTEYPKSREIMGHPLVNGYQSHYCVTKKGGLPFTREDYEAQTIKYDEVVIGQESQAVPLFLLKMNKTNVGNLIKEWDRDVAENK